MAVPFNIVIVAQAGRLSYEALLFLASLRQSDPDFKGRVLIAMPQKGEKWRRDPAVKVPEILALYERMGAEIMPFESGHFGSDYPTGNKIECLSAMPEGEPFIFFDSDTLVLGPLSSLKIDFNRPSASMNRLATWPKPELYHAGYEEIWRSLYDKFGLDFESSLEPKLAPDDWRRYLYFNAGWFYGPCPVKFGRRFTEWAVAIRNDPPEALAAQAMEPWLDQITLPLVLHSFGGGRPDKQAAKLDDKLTCHWRALPLLYATGDEGLIGFLEELVKPNWLKKVLRTYEPFLQFIWKKQGQQVRELFPGGTDGLAEKVVRNRIKTAELWMR